VVAGNNRRRFGAGGGAHARTRIEFRELFAYPCVEPANARTVVGVADAPRSSTKGSIVSVTLGVLARLEAKPGRGPDLGAFLERGREIAVAEQGTVTWYAFKINEMTYGIFDTFETDAARDAHLGGQIPAALGQVAADLLASAPTIETVDVIAVK
jgi:quinol monooxygenase YgiN